MKAETVQSKRIGKVVNEALENDMMKQEYETLTSDLLQWIEETIADLNQREFINSLSGVQGQLSEFHTYRLVARLKCYLSAVLY